MIGKNWERAAIFSKPVEDDDNRFTSKQNDNYYIWKPMKNVYLWEKNKTINYKCTIKDIFCDIDGNISSDEDINNTDHIANSLIKTEQNCLEMFAIEVKDSMLATLQSSNPYDQEI
uniref:Translation initiation factor eIF-2B subunit epsilon (inferred by orthology to a human protein) n=1 Tax=Strongyloides venezuelensis TaxID=75913 RepID=A0A0K0F0J8_STRVS